MKKTIIVLICAFIVVATTLSIVFYIYGQNSVKPKMEKVQFLLDSTNTELSNFQSLSIAKTIYIDSLHKVNSLLSKYRTLTEAMSYRDSIRKPLEFKIGENIRMKRDSSYVLVDDIIVGGDKFSYYIKYIVEHKDKSLETVSPEKLYK